jgi:hypothetical protein
MSKTLWVLFVAISPIVCEAKDSYFDRSSKSVHCSEAIPEFTLSREASPSNAEVKKLCTCVWNSFPAGGWERDVSSAIARGSNPGSQVQGFISKFGEAMKKCGAYRL